MEHIAQGKRSDTLGLPHSRVSAPCKGKSFNPLCCYSYLIADLAVLKWNIVCIFCSTPAPCLKAFALSGRDCSNTRYPGCRFACPGLCAPLGFQPAFAKSETLVSAICEPTFVLFFPRNEAAEKYPTRDASPPLELAFRACVSC